MEKPKKTKLNIGIDEVGRGCFLGPVVSCAVCFDHNNLPDKKLLKKLKDSKELTPKKREEICKLLIKESVKKNPKIVFGIGTVDSQIIDEVNIRQATKMAMQRALDELYLKIDKEQINAVLVDGRDNFSFEGLNKKPVFIIKGDSKIDEIKAASIIAKVFRDKIIDVYSLIYPKLSLEKNKGYGAKKHLEGLKEKKDLTGIHRFTYKPVRRVFEKKPKLLLHVCCGPDIIVPIKELKDKYKIFAFWYDPNIHPKEEYFKRLNAFKQICEIENIEWREGEYDSEKYFELVKGFENEKEGGERCEICFDMRLHRSIIEAVEQKCLFWTTTLNASPHKDFNKLTEIGLRLEKKYNIKYLPINFLKNNGFLKSVNYCKEKNIYRQNYCGCVFSKYRNSKSQKTKSQINIKFQNSNDQNAHLIFGT